jgi:hypothetical protein
MFQAKGRQIQQEMPFITTAVIVSNVGNMYKCIYLNNL